MWRCGCREQNRKPLRHGCKINFKQQNQDRHPVLRPKLGNLAKRTENTGTTCRVSRPNPRTFIYSTQFCKPWSGMPCPAQLNESDEDPRRCKITKYLSRLPINCLLLTVSNKYNQKQINLGIISTKFPGNFIFGFHSMLQQKIKQLLYLYFFQCQLLLFQISIFFSVLFYKIQWPN